MIFKIPQTNGIHGTNSSDEANKAMLANLARIDEMRKPVKMADFIDKLPQAKQMLDGINRAVFNVREALGKNTMILDSLLLRTTCELDMRANAETCYLQQSGDAPFKIIMSHDLFTLQDFAKTTEMLAIMIAQIIEFRIFNTTTKHFHFQLIYYLMGFDPMKERKEREEAKKLLGA